MSTPDARPDTTGLREGRCWRGECRTVCGYPGVCTVVAHPDPTPEPDHECSYDTPGAGPCVTCLTDAEMAEMNFIEAETLRRINLAREQGRAEGDAEWAAAATQLADECLLHEGMFDASMDTEEHRISDRTWVQAGRRIQTLLTADRTKALDAVKAHAAREAVDHERVQQADRLTNAAASLASMKHQTERVTAKRAGVLLALSYVEEDRRVARADRDTDGGAS